MDKTYSAMLATLNTQAQQNQPIWLYFHALRQ
jgi:hypothetical protein